MKRILILFMAGMAGALVFAPVHAEYPDKLIRWIITMPPGGANDILARPLAQRLSEAIGQQVIVDNRGGAGGLIGAEATAKSPPDGYTMVLLTIAHAIGASLYTKVSYDLVRDFAPVTLLATTPGIVVVPPSLPVKSIRELIAIAKARPGQLSYGSSGNGSPTHLAGELFNYLAGVKIVHIPYKGGGPLMVALLSGEVILSFASMPPALPHIRSGKLRALAVTTAQRQQSLPELPTVAEAGVPGYAAEIWYGHSLPAAAPKEIVARLNAEFGKILRSQETIQQLDKSGFEARPSTPEQYAAFTKSEIDKWAKVVRAADMRAD
jgi:tripartite-type tricarboxylate transporter receptor subunit TctC